MVIKYIFCLHFLEDKLSYLIKIEKNSLSLSNLEKFKDEKYGAFFSFVGIVRNINNNNYVKNIQYIVFEDLFFSLLKKKCERILSDNVNSKIYIFQREGILQVGDINLIVSVFSVHRKYSFLYCENIVEYIKNSIPVWKKETYIDNSYVWINS
jgi:molybdopterin synthase catalytic subunit